METIDEEFNFIIDKASYTKMRKKRNLKHILSKIKINKSLDKLEPKR